MSSIRSTLTPAALAVALVVTAWTPARASIVTFDDGGLTCALDTSTSSCSDGGLTFTLGSSGLLYVWDGSSPNSNGTNNLILGFGPADFVEITQTGGGSFDLNSIDLAISWYDSNPAEVITVNGVPLLITQTLTTYALNLVGVSAVDISGVASGTGYWTGDNIDINANTPEPASLALFSAGLIALGLIRRKRA